MHRLRVVLINSARFNLPADAVEALRKQLSRFHIGLVTTDMSVTTIKNFCPILLTHNIMHVEASYDGSGDSGDLDIAFRIETIRQEPGNNPPVTLRDAIGEREMEKLLVEGPQPLTTHEKFTEFVAALWDLLPDGWEIDDGSFGEIVVDTTTREITVEHNERYTEVRSTTETY